MQVALLTLVLGTVLIAMMWFFTVGTATRRDLHAIFDPLDDSGQIEPWMIEHVTARIALTTTGDIPVVPDDESAAAPTVRATYVPGGSPIAARSLVRCPAAGSSVLGLRPASPRCGARCRSGGVPRSNPSPNPAAPGPGATRGRATAQGSQQSIGPFRQQSPRRPADAVRRARVPAPVSPAPSAAPECPRPTMPRGPSSSRPGQTSTGNPPRHSGAHRVTARRCRDAIAESDR